MDFNRLLKTTWRFFTKNIVDLVLFVLVGCLLTLTIVLIPTVVGGWTRGILAYVREDKKPEFNELWNFDQFGSILLLIIVGGALTSIGFLLLVIPGIILSILWMYSLLFIVDKRMGFWEAMTASREAVVQTGFFNHFVIWLIAAVLHSIGAASYGLVTILTLPFTLVLLTVVYRNFSR